MLITSSNLEHVWEQHECRSKVCYTCGLNTLSNFNRLFRKRKGCNPTEFREKYQKTTIII